MEPNDTIGQLTRCPIRTITAGINLADVRDFRPIEHALALLKRARVQFEDAGFDVQTVRIATSPVIAGASARQREIALEALRTLDQLLQENEVSASIGPCSSVDGYDEDLPAWIAELLRVTRRLRCSMRVATVGTGIDGAATRMAAETMVALARITPEGAGNFQFAAAACIPSGTPFYPVAFHEGPTAIALALESASLVEQGVIGLRDPQAATARIRSTMARTLAGIERCAMSFSERENCIYRGIDTSPAPGLDRSIGAAIEALTQRPFGEAGTVDACATITAALRTLPVKSCGYSGLMLPVLEDRVLAARASEGRFGLRDLLLCSAVCGTGLDVVPVPGDTPVDVVAGIIRDTAAVASRWAKPLATRLFLVPGKRTGEMAIFSDPELTSCRVMAA